MTDTSPSSPGVLRALIFVLAVQGMSGLAGGFSLISDPTGAAIGLPLEWLRGSPFSDYFVPGLVLFTALGVGPLVVAWALWTDRSWSLRAALLIGVALLVWIGVEITVIGYQSDPPLQLVYGALGAAIVVLSTLPPVRDGDLRRFEP